MIIILLILHLILTTSCSKSEYVIYKLKEMGKVTEKDILQITKKFERLDKGHCGKITLADLMESHLWFIVGLSLEMKVHKRVLLVRLNLHKMIMKWCPENKGLNAMYFLRLLEITMMVKKKKKRWSINWTLRKNTFLHDLRMATTKHWFGLCQMVYTQMQQKLYIIYIYIYEHLRAGWVKIQVQTYIVSIWLVSFFSLA